MAVIQLNNELRTLEIQEQKEIEAVLADLSNQLTPYTTELAIDLQILTRLDFIFAKAALSRHFKCSEPKFNTEGRIHIKDGRFWTRRRWSRSPYGLAPILIFLWSPDQTPVVKRFP